MSLTAFLLSLRQCHYAPALFSCAGWRSCLLLLIILADLWLAHGTSPPDSAVSTTILSKLTWQVSQKSKTRLFKLVARKKDWIILILAICLGYWFSLYEINMPDIHLLNEKRLLQWSCAVLSRTFPRSLEGLWWTISDALTLMSFLYWVPIAPGPPRLRRSANGESSALAF